MTAPGKYRFTLQWGAETEEKIRAGDFLKGLGNRKSELVVMAVTEYLETHPELRKAGIKFVVRPSYTREQMEALVKAVIEEKMAGLPAMKAGTPDSVRNTAEPDIDEMLKNLELFS